MLNFCRFGPINFFSFYSLALVKFSKQPDSDCYLVVGVAKDYQLNPKQFSAGYLDTYK